MGLSSHSCYQAGGLLISALTEDLRSDTWFKAYPKSPNYQSPVPNPDSFRIGFKGVIHSF
jgi:hypothetical protein